VGLRAGAPHLVVRDGRAVSLALRAAQGAEIRKPEAWRQQVLWDMRFGPGGLYWETAVGEVRWLAKRIGPPDVQAVAHTDELAEQQGRPL